MNAFHFITYTALEQLDAFGISAVFRTLGSFADLEDEAEQFRLRLLAELRSDPEPLDAAIDEEFAKNEAETYYHSLREMAQAVTNLLAVGLYHLYEQHERKVATLRMEAGATARYDSAPWREEDRRAASRCSYC